MSKPFVFKRIISVLTLLAFSLFSSLSYADIPKKTLFGTKSYAQRFAQPEEDKKIIDVYKSPSALVVPEEAGRVVDYFKGGGDGLVIHIQDRHADGIAQLNIARIISSLAENYGVNTLCLEAASKRLDTSFYDRFPDDKAKEKVSGFFVNKGLFTGPEYYKINNREKNILAFGVEDKDLYLQHLQSHHQGQPDQEKALAWLKSLSAITENLKLKVYSKELSRHDVNTRAYNTKVDDIEEYLTYLIQKAAERTLDLSGFPNAVCLDALSRQEKEIDFAQAESQRKQLIEALVKRLNQQEAKELLAFSLHYKMGKISDVAFYDYLRNILDKVESIPKSDFEELFAYIKYLQKSKDIDHLKLFDETERLQEAVAEALFENDRQKGLYQVSEKLDTLKGLFTLTLSPRQLKKLNNHGQGLDIDSMVSFIKSEAQGYNIGAGNLSLKDGSASRQVKAAKEYYELALKRDYALVNNTIKKLGLGNHRSAILVVGGFHTDGVTTALREKDISYVVICPNIGDGDYQQLYSQLMADKMPPLGSLLEVTAQTLGHALACGDIAADFEKYVKIAWTLALKSVRADDIQRDALEDETVRKEIERQLTELLNSGVELEVDTVIEIVAATVDNISTDRILEEAARDGRLSQISAEQREIIKEALKKKGLGPSLINKLVGNRRIQFMELAKGQDVWFGEHASGERVTVVVPYKWNGQPTEAIIARLLHGTGARYGLEDKANPIVVEEIISQDNWSEQATQLAQAIEGRKMVKKDLAFYIDEGKVAPRDMAYIDTDDLVTFAIRHYRRIFSTDEGIEQELFERVLIVVTEFYAVLNSGPTPVDTLWFIRENDKNDKGDKDILRATAREHALSKQSSAGSAQAPDIATGVEDPEAVAKRLSAQVFGEGTGWRQLLPVLNQFRAIRNRYPNAVETALIVNEAIRDGRSPELVAKDYAKRVETEIRPGLVEPRVPSVGTAALTALEAEVAELTDLERTQVELEWAAERLKLFMSGELTGLAKEEQEETVREELTTLLDLLRMSSSLENELRTIREQTEGLPASIDEAKRLHAEAAAEVMSLGSKKLPVLEVLSEEGKVAVRDYVQGVIDWLNDLKDSRTANDAKDEIMRLVKPLAEFAPEVYEAKKASLKRVKMARGIEPFDFSALDELALAARKARGITVNNAAGDLIQEVLFGADDKPLKDKAAEIAEVIVVSRLEEGAFKNRHDFIKRLAAKEASSDQAFKAAELLESMGIGFEGELSDKDRGGDKLAAYRKSKEALEKMATDQAKELIKERDRISSRIQKVAARIEKAKKNIQTNFEREKARLEDKLLRGEGLIGVKAEIGAVSGQLIQKAEAIETAKDKVKLAKEALSRVTNRELIFLEAEKEAQAVNEAVARRAEVDAGLRGIRRPFSLARRGANEALNEALVKLALVSPAEYHKVKQKLQAEGQEKKMRPINFKEADQAAIEARLKEEGDNINTISYELFRDILINTGAAEFIVNPEAVFAEIVCRRNERLFRGRRDLSSFLSGLIGKVLDVGHPNLIIKALGKSYKISYNNKDTEGKEIRIPEQEQTAYSELARILEPLKTAQEAHKLLQAKHQALWEEAKSIARMRIRKLRQKVEQQRAILASLQKREERMRSPSEEEQAQRRIAANRAAFETLSAGDVIVGTTTIPNEPFKTRRIILSVDKKRGLVAYRVNRWLQGPHTVEDVKLEELANLFSATPDMHFVDHVEKAEQPVQVRGIDDRVLALAIREGYVSEVLLEEELGKSPAEAEGIIEAIEAKGLVGPAMPEARREIFLASRKAAEIGEAELAETREPKEATVSIDELLAYAAENSALLQRALQGRGIVELSLLCPSAYIVQASLLHNQDAVDILLERADIERARPMQPNVKVFDIVVLGSRREWEELPEELRKKANFKFADDILGLGPESKATDDITKLTSLIDSLKPRLRGSIMCHLTADMAESIPEAAKEEFFEDKVIIGAQVACEEDVKLVTKDGRIVDAEGLSFRLVDNNIVWRAEKRLRGLLSAEDIIKILPAITSEDFVNEFQNLKNMVDEIRKAA